MTRTVVILLAIGFIPALVISWVFELTPDGLKRDSEVTHAESIAPLTARRMNRAITVVMLLALGYFAVDKFVLLPSRVVANNPPAKAASPVSAANAIDSKSVAVLAFANMSADKDNEYFSDGVAEEILNALAKIDDLKVAGCTSRSSSPKNCWPGSDRLADHAGATGRDPGHSHHRQRAA